MGAPDVMNDIKVIFFIVNTIVGLLAGLLTISFGVSSAVLMQRLSNDEYYSYYSLEIITITCIIVGLIVLGVAALGYAGAIRQNRIMLFVYTGVMVLVAVVDIWQMTMRTVRSVSDVYFLVPSITHLGLVVLAISLALILAVKSRNQRNQGMILSPAPAAYTPVA